MKLSRTRQYKLNMGNYESMELSATVSLDAVDILDEDELADMDPDEVLAALKEACDRYLDTVMADDMKTAAELSDAPTSMLFADPPAPEKPRKTEKMRSRR